MKKNVHQEIKQFILNELRPRMRASPGIEDVIVWIKYFNEKTGTVHLGFALGSSTGCSPFCGCAAKQLTEIIGLEIQKVFPFVNKIVGTAELPSNDYILIWNNI